MNKHNIENKVPSEKWTQLKAVAWYKQQPWLVGCNYIPANAINQIEMWNEETFSPEVIDKELRWAHEAGFNTMRVFLHYLPWKVDKEGFYDRVDQFLDICEKNQISAMLIFFDDVWNPECHIGKQPEPTPHVHNSGWVQCPGQEILRDLDRHDILKPYVQETMERYKNDNRVLIWDIYNEPGNTHTYKDKRKPNKKDYTLILLKKSFEWAREVNPSQPITSGFWSSIYGRNLDKLNKIDEFCYKNSDILTFHYYSTASNTDKLCKILSEADRPSLCTEFLCRTNKSDLSDLLPVFKKYNIGTYNWGLVNGKSQTIYPHKSWDSTFVAPPKIWYHDVFHADGTPYDEKEIATLRELTN